MYITYDKESRKVTYIGEKKPIAYSEGLECAQIETVPEKYHYLTFENNELVSHFVELTPEEKATKQQEHYEAKVEELIRKKYTLSNELAILRQRDSKPEEFTAYNNYAEECKILAKAEIEASN
jgi:hypothetical protein